MAVPKPDPLEAEALAGPLPRVFILPRRQLVAAPRPARIGGESITFVAPHPAADDLVYVTTGPPALLDFLPDPAVEIEDWDRLDPDLDD
ncbi:MAG: hypothetical protein IPM64_16375 [Phycisphaerales bacterium]|nr:hypothetical protein [Phycisphaerales bacterium]